MVSPNPPPHDAGGRLRPAWPAESTVSATFSDCGRYRYQLREVWDPSGPVVLWLMMNPSVACLEYGDPTLRRTGNFTRRFPRSLRNLFDHYAAAVDHTVCFLNTSSPPHVVFAQRDGSRRTFDQSLYDGLMKEADR